MIFSSNVTTVNEWTMNWTMTLLSKGALLLVGAVVHLFPAVLNRQILTSPTIQNTTLREFHNLNLTSPTIQNTTLREFHSLNLTSPTIQNTTFRGSHNLSFTDVNASTISTPQPRVDATEQDGESGQQPTVSKELYDKMDRILNHFIFYFQFFSIFLTLSSACVYALPNMRCATACYLVGLNSVDTLSGLLSVIHKAWETVDVSAATSSAGFHHLTVWSIFFAVASRRMLYCFSLLLSAERFFVIAFPLKARHLKIIRYPKLCSLVMVMVIQAYHVYMPLKYTVVPSSGGSGYVLTYSDAFKAHKQVFIDMSSAAKIIFSYIPLVLCLGLSAALMAALLRHTESRKSLHETQHHDRKAHSACSAERQLAMTIWVSFP